MLEALWTIYFGDATVPGMQPGMSNAGTAVLETGRVFGGDSQYYYLGTFAVNDRVLSGTARITHFNGPVNTAWGTDEKQFDVAFEGNVGEDVIDGAMWRPEMPQMKLPIKMIRQADLP